MDDPTNILPLRTEKSWFHVVPSSSTNQQSPVLLLQPSEVGDSEVLVIDTRLAQDCRQISSAADNELFGADGNFDYGPSDTIDYTNIYQVFGDEAAALLTRYSLVCHSGPAVSVERGCFGADIKYSTRTPPSLNFSSIIVSQLLFVSISGSYSHPEEEPSKSQYATDPSPQPEINVNYFSVEGPQCPDCLVLFLPALHPFNGIIDSQLKIYDTFNVRLCRSKSVLI
ncbi:hypothetical protein ARMGADRAFT_1037046 [Armillaria gallica]|uniref:Uncharacterized protein n=1 Tax=Armillaria gallica TaxID=47427 RepID=A0A2H3D8D3_ARMGA|nr:hypothetical protein ARMGADRAFT_1037046 [Armillaria gallica]